MSSKSTKDTSRVTQIFKAPDSSESKHPVLVVISGHLLDIGRFIQLGENAIIIGRDASTDFALNDEQISRRHLRISDLRQAAESFEISVEDLNSTNGTTINGKRIQKSACVLEETIGLGETILLFRMEGLENIQNPSNPLQMVAKDPLTGIFNRRAFEQVLKHNHNQARKNQRTYCLMILDLDHFKEINDTHGHAIGDEVLRRVAQLLSREIRSGDILARYGGEEFIVLLPGIGVFDGYIAAERLRSKVAALQLDDIIPGLRIRVSIGIAEVNLARQSTDDLFHRSDMALLQAKKEGRNRTVIAPGRDSDQTTQSH